MQSLELTELIAQARAKLKPCKYCYGAVPIIRCFKTGFGGVTYSIRPNKFLCNCIKEGRSRIGLHLTAPENDNGYAEFILDKLANAWNNLN